MPHLLITRKKIRSMVTNVPSHTIFPVLVVGDFRLPLLKIRSPSFVLAGASDPWLQFLRSNFSH
jgi:hypothetical protein